MLVSRQGCHQDPSQGIGSVIHQETICECLERLRFGSIRKTPLGWQEFNVSPDTLQRPVVHLPKGKSRILHGVNHSCSGFLRRLNSIEVTNEWSRRVVDAAPRRPQEELDSRVAAECNSENLSTSHNSAHRLLRAKGAEPVAVDRSLG